MSKSQPNPAWFLAAETNDVPKLKKHLFHSIKKLDTSGRSALMYAASAASEDAIKFLVEDEGQIRGPGGWTALMEASAAGQLRSIALLSPLLSGARLLDGHSYFRKGTTALVISAEKGDFAAVQMLQGEQDAAGWTELHWAAFNQRWAEIYGQQQQFSRVDLVRRTPVFYAVFAKNETRKELSYGHRLAVQEQCIELDDKQYGQILHFLCKQPDSMQFKLDSYGKSPLHYAVEMGNLVAVRVLVKYFGGVVTGKQCKDYCYGTSALMIAVLNQNVEMVYILAKYEHGLKNELGIPAIHLANAIPQQNLRIQILQLLYQKEKKILIKERVNGVLNVSTMEQSLKGDLVNSLEQSTRVEQDFNEILEGMTEDNKEEVCEYLCEKLQNGMANKEADKELNNEDLGFAELYIKDMDDMHIIIRSILDIILQKTQVGHSQDYQQQQSLMIHDFESSIKQNVTEQSLSEYVQVLQSENKTLKQNIQDMSLNIENLQKSNSSQNTDSSNHVQLVNSQDQIFVQLQNELNQCKQQNQKLQDEIKSYQSKVDQSNHLLSQSLGDSNQNAQLSLSPHKNPFKHENSSTNGLNANTDVLLSLNSTSVQNSQLIDLNKKLTDLELINRQYKEDLQINTIMYEEKFTQLKQVIKQSKDESLQLQKTIDQLLEEINTLQNIDQDNKDQIVELEAQVDAALSDNDDLAEKIRKIESQNHSFAVDKQFLAEYITDLTTNVINLQKQLTEKDEQQQLNMSQFHSSRIDQEQLHQQQLNQQTYIQQLEIQIKDLTSDSAKLRKQNTTMQQQLNQQDQTISQLSASIISNIDTINLQFNLNISRSLDLANQLQQAFNYLTQEIVSTKKKNQQFDQGIDIFINQLSQHSNQLLQTVSQVETQ